MVYTSPDDRIRAQTTLQVWCETGQQDGHRHHVAHVHRTQRGRRRPTVANTWVVRGEPVQVLHRFFDLLVRPRADLIANRTQRGSSDAGSGATDRLQEIHLLLDGGLDAAVGAVVPQVLYRVLEVLHERVEVRVLVGERPQVAHEAREHPGQRRAEDAGAPQVVAQAELVVETGEQVEVAIRELVAAQVIKCRVRRLQERHHRSLARQIARGRLFEGLPGF